MSKTLKAVISFLIPFFAGFIGSLFTFSAIPTWYATLNKPTFSPPNWLFGPAWTILYILIGISLFIVLNNKENKNKKSALIIFGLQMFFNSLWSIIFFGLKSPLSALFIIYILWILILLNIIKFYKIQKSAGVILIPYLLWVTFASFLNLFIVLLN